VLVVNGDMELRGLITVKDILKSTEHPLACKDEHGRLRVAPRSASAPARRNAPSASSTRAWT
jgi:IMP dehydrogenase